MRAERRWSSARVIFALADVVVMKDVPEHLRSDFYSIKELRVLAERWRFHYNTIRPHSSLGYTPDGGYWNSEGAALH